MNYFLFFLLSTFMGGIVLRNRSERQRSLVLGLYILVLTLLYYLRDGML